MNRIAQIGIIVQNRESAERVNAVLHDFGDYIVGRMGLPLKERGISVISVVLDAPADIINSVAGKLGSIPGVSAKAVYAAVSCGI